MVVSLHQQPRDKSVSVGWQQWLQMGIWCFRSAVVSDDSTWRDQRGWELMDPHQTSLSFCVSSDGPEWLRLQMSYFARIES